jgi:Eco57I restriction-modification methylase
MSESIELLSKLATDFSETNLTIAFRSIARNFRPIGLPINSGSETDISNSILSGEILLETGNISVSSHLVGSDLSERSGRKKQFEYAKSFLKTSENQKFQAGIFVFHDAAGNFRMSLIYAESDGSKRLWNNFRRSTYFVSPKLPNKTFIRQLKNLSFSSLDDIKTAFSITAVTDLFYEEFFSLFDGIVESCRAPKNKVSNLLAKDFATLFVIRIIFLGFIQKKSWIGNDEEFLNSMWKEYLYNRKAEDNFYRDWLTPLFFRALNSPFGQELPKSITKITPSYRSKFANAPYLNGGLFKPRENIDDQEIYISDEKVAAFFEFLFSHSFTIEENSNQDEDLQLNPEFLGIIFERLVNGENGAVYTPRPEVDFMCRAALAKWFIRNFPNLDSSAINSLIFRSKESGRLNVELLSIKDQRQILRSLETLSICDPAVGSGAFLVGMMQVIEELTDLLYQSVGKKTRDRFSLKREIVRENLFGVEVKEWAVWICQLRLWLTIFIEAPDSLVKSEIPILPSLDFKIRQGDSLVQLVGKTNFPIGSIGQTISPKLQKKIEEIRVLKAKYFENLEAIDLRALKKKEVSIYEEILDEQIMVLDKKIPKMEAELENASNSLFGKLDSTDPNISRLENDIQMKISLRDDLHSQKRVISNEKPLVWSIEFSEIFSTKGGFDIIIGNPPYIRHEDIEDPLGRIKDKSEYKGHLEEMIRDDFPGYFTKKMKINTKSDLYTYFYIRSLRLLNDRGVHVFICSNSWLDVEYGAWLQKFLLDEYEMSAIYESSGKRSFNAADVNTIISVIVTVDESENRSTKFVNIKSGFEDFAYSENVNNLEKSDSNLLDNSFRSICISRNELIASGSEQGSGDIIQSGGSGPGIWIGDKWGSKYLRSPDCYNKVVFNSGNKFARLSNLAEIKRGLTTGITDFFFIDKATINHWKIESEYLLPVLDSVQNAYSYSLKVSQIDKYLFSCELPKSALKGTSALKYISFGESQKTKKGISWPRVTTVQGRKYWYALGDGSLLKGDLLSQRLIRERFYFIETENFIASDHFFVIKFLSRKDKDLLIALMNSTFTYFQCEIFGRTNQTGIINIYKPELNQLLIPDPKLIPPILREQIIAAYKKLRKCEVPKILDEIGFDKESNSCSPNSPRKEIDLLIYKALGYSSEDLNEMYVEFAHLVESRKSKELNS